MTSPHERFLFLIFYWLNPWRVFFSAFLWNPNFVVLASAIQLWTLYKQRSRASFGASCALVVGIGFLFQLHAQVVILAVATLLCWVTGISKYSIRGVLAGVLVVGLTLAPWALHVLNNPAHLPIRNEKNFIGRSLVNPIHLATGIEMIARYGSFDVMNKISRIDLTPRLGATVDKAATPYLGALMEGVAYPSYVVSWVALLAVLARVGRSAFAKGEGLSDREWLERVIVLHLSAGVLMVALSPTTIMGWQLQVLLPSIAFTLVLFFSRLAERLVIFSRVYLALWIAACLVLLPAIGIGVPYYRPGGRFSVGIPLRNDHPILHELKLLEHSSMCIRKDGVGWWSDVLPDLNPPTSEEGEWRGGKPADPAASCPGP